MVNVFEKEFRLEKAVEIKAWGKGRGKKAVGDIGFFGNLGTGRKY
jgi:hypothetical protein